MLKKALSFVVAIAISATIALPSNVFASGLSSSGTGSIQNGGIIIDDGRPPTVSDDPTYPPINPPADDNIPPTTTPTPPPSTTTPPQQPSVFCQTIDQAVDTIQQHYLHRNSDGTFYIDSAAQSVLDNNLLQQITNGMSAINGLINSNQLYTDTSNNVMAVTTPQAYAYSSSQSPSTSNIDGVSSTTGTVADLGNVVWHWYGFDVWSNRDQSTKMYNILSNCAYQLGFGASAGSFLKTPYGLIVYFGAGVYAYDFYLGAQQCAIGANNGGSVTYFLGKPSWAIFTHSRAIIYR